MSKLSENIERKFTETIDLSDWEIETEDGWKDLSSVSKTIPYEVYYMETENGKELYCADDHIIFDEQGNEIFVKDSINQNILTKDGVEKVIKVQSLEYEEEMFDVEISSDNHSYYSNDILSHNSITLASFALHATLFERDYQVGIASNKMVNAKELMDRIKFSYENIPNYLKPAVREYNRFSISFDNGSSIESATTTESTFRGKTKSLLILDEFAFVNQAIVEEFWTSLLPSIEAEGENSSTKLAIISTPNGSTNKFAELWFEATQGNNGFATVTIDPYEVPGRTEDWRQKMINKLGLLKFQQEFEMKFLNTNNTLIDPRVIESLPKKEPLFEYRGIRFFNNCEGRKIMISLDPSEGGEKDDHAIEIFDIETFEQIGEFNDNMLPQSYLTSLFIDLIHYVWDHGASDVYYIVENNGIGIGVINLLEQNTDNYLGRTEHVSVGNNKIGHTTTNPTKSKGCMLFKDLLETKRMTLYSEKLINQLKFFSKKGNSYSAEKGFRDDLVMSTVINLNAINQIMLWEEKTYERLNEVPSLSTEEDNNDEPSPIIF